MKKIITTLIITILMISIAPKTKATAAESYKEINLPKGATLVIPNGSSGYVKTNATTTKTYDYYTRTTSSARISREQSSQEVYISGEMRFYTEKDVIFSVPQSIYPKIKIENQPLFEKVLVDPNKAYQLTPKKDGLATSVVLNYDATYTGLELQLDKIIYDEKGGLTNYAKAKKGKSSMSESIPSGGKVRFSNPSKDKEYALVPTIHKQNLTTTSNTLFYDFTLKPSQTVTSINEYHNESNYNNIQNFEYDNVFHKVVEIETVGYNRQGAFTKIGAPALRIQEYKVKAGNRTSSNIPLYVPMEMKGKVSVSDGLQELFHKVTLKSGQSFHYTDTSKVNKPLSIAPTGNINSGNFDIVRLNDDTVSSDITLGRTYGMNSQGGKYIDIRNNHGNPLDIYIRADHKSKYTISNNPVVIEMSVLPNTVYKIDTKGTSSFISKTKTALQNGNVAMSNYNNDYSFSDTSVSRDLSFYIKNGPKSKFMLTGDKGGSMYVPTRLKGYINRAEDVDNSGKVDIKDLSSVAKYYNTKPSYSVAFNHNVNFLDMYNDYFIDIYDIVKVARVM
ncbi:MAG: hypothetical protein ACRC7N_01880 [Clostridium sp.]